MIRTKFDKIRFCDTVVRGPKGGREIYFYWYLFLRSLSSIYHISQNVFLYFSLFIFSQSKPLSFLHCKAFSKKKISHNEIQFPAISVQQYILPDEYKKKINLLPTNDCHFQSYFVRNFGRYLSRCLFLSICCRQIDLRICWSERKETKKISRTRMLQERQKFINPAFTHMYIAHPQSSLLFHFLLFTELFNSSKSIIQNVECNSYITLGSLNS